MTQVQSSPGLVLCVAETSASPLPFLTIYMLPTPWFPVKPYRLYIHDTSSPCIQFNRGFDDGLRHLESLFFETLPTINTQLMHSVSEAWSAPSLYCLSTEAKAASKMLCFNGILMTGKGQQKSIYEQSWYVYPLSTL